jgi:ankyrin repeat protein
LKAGTDVNAKDEYRKTALMFAVMVLDNTPEVVSLLLQNGADVNAKDKDGKSDDVII